MGLVYEFMEKHLEPEAFLLFDLELNPQTYFIPLLEEDEEDYSRFKHPGKLNTKQVAEFLGYEVTKESVKFINYLRKSIEFHTIKAREYFNSPAFPLN